MKVGPVGEDILKNLCRQTGLRVPQKRGGSNMLCEKCHQKQATVHMQQIVNGTKTEMHLCQDCSSQIDSPITIEALFNGLLGSFLSMAQEKQGNIKPNIHYEPCKTCGMTYEGFKNGGGKLGCMDCYRVFSRELESIFKSVQASTKHEGKFPQRSGRSMFQEREAGRLRILMKKAIEEENFEEAARLRDEIRVLEAAPDNTAESDNATAPDRTAAPDHPVGSEYSVAPDHTVGSDHPAAPDHPAEWAGES